MKFRIFDEKKMKKVKKKFLKKGKQIKNFFYKKWKKNKMKMKKNE